MVAQPVTAQPAETPDAMMKVLRVSLMRAPDVGDRLTLGMPKTVRLCGL
jgi:hypothetical protein